MKSIPPKPTLIRQTIQKAFSKASSTYDDYAVMQKYVGEQLINRLHLLKEVPVDILNVGSATGQFALSLQNIFSHCHVIQLDLTYAMLAHAQSTTAHNFEFINADAAFLPFADHSVSMVISNLMLHWSSDPQAVINEWQRVLKPDGALFFSTLGHNTLKELKETTDQFDSMPHIHEFFDMHDVGDMLLKAGFHNPVMDSSPLQFHYSSIKKLFLDLKYSGCYNIIPNRRKSLTGKTRWQQIEAHYPKVNSKYRATYEIIHGHAWGTDLSNFSQNDESGAPSISIQKLRQIIRGQNK